MEISIDRSKGRGGFGSFVSTSIKSSSTTTGGNQGFVLGSGKKDAVLFSGGGGMGASGGLGNYPSVLGTTANIGSTFPLTNTNNKVVGEGGGSRPTFHRGSGAEGYPWGSPVNAASIFPPNSNIGGGCTASRPRFHDAGIDLDDPTPDIWDLFRQFDVQYFDGTLAGVSVEWSKRLTSCAGICHFKGKYGGCEIRLSEPLLSYRPRSDLIDTLIHEMIHAYLFLVDGNRERDGHGPKFQNIMNKINAKAGTKITIYHSFHDEVNYHRKHWWKCDGPCRNRAPFFGLVKRAMNRAPGPSDRWYPEHQATCGGHFIKIKEPEKKPTRTTKDKTNVAGGRNTTKNKSLNTSSTSNSQQKKGNKSLLDFFTPVDKGQSEAEDKFPEEFEFFPSDEDMDCITLD